MNGLLRKSIILMTIVSVLACGVACGNKDIERTQKKLEATEKSGEEKVSIEIWSEFLPDYKEALRVIYLSLEINTDSWDKDGFFLVVDEYNRIEELKTVLNAAFTNEFIEKNKSELRLFDGENAFYRENEARLYLKAAEVIIRPFPEVSGRYPDSIEQNDSELIVTFNGLDDGFGKKYNAVFTLCRDESGEWKLNAYESYSFEGESLINIDDRSFQLEDIPENIAEETVMKDFLYTITADFDSKYSILADLDPHNISIENEKKWFQKDVYTQSCTIQKISTLSKDEFNNDKSLYGWKEKVDKYNLSDYKIVNVEYTVTLSEKANALGPQYGEGTISRSFIVGKPSTDSPYKIYDFGEPLFIDHR
ncbi:MAG: hypothetical protein GX811_12375 [Lentisphaerae bacterium]|nr:hypothetical protein [Lentisphaerota bacterium]